MLYLLVSLLLIAMQIVCLPFMMIQLEVSLLLYVNHSLQVVAAANAVIDSVNKDELIKFLAHKLDPEEDEAEVFVHSSDAETPQHPHTHTHHHHHPRVICIFANHISIGGPWSCCFIELKPPVGVKQIDEEANYQNDPGTYAK